jgi:hypothetical protein
MYIQKKIVFLVFFYTLVFSLLIFSFDIFFFSGNKEQNTEEKFIDISSQEKNNDSFSYIGPLDKKDRKIYTSVLSRFFEEKETLSTTWSLNNSLPENNISIAPIKEDNLSEKKYEFFYVPESWKEDSYLHTDNLKIFLDSSSIDKKTSSLFIQMNKEIFDVRGKFKDKTVKLFWVGSLSKEEVVSVFVHEFWHYIDLYFLILWDTSDPSGYFYENSWEGTKVIKEWQTQEDFVSWYAMTNKYEDFAESFIYYILHNEDFLEKAKSSISLMKKYSFFEKYVFMWWDFKATNFWNEAPIQPYYWDITKIKINLEKFLQFLKNWV